MIKDMRMAAAVAASALCLAACAGGRVNARKDTPRPPAISAPTETGRTVDDEPDVRDANLRAIAGVKTIEFAYDSDGLDEAARGVLKANAKLLNGQRDIKIQVAGHCDQRGTIAYNLALGQRRAKAVRDYYKALGVDGARIATISWGTERPLCSESMEDCWARNRRAETLEAVSAKVAGVAR